MTTVNILIYISPPSMHAWWWVEKKNKMGQVRPFKVIDFFGCYLVLDSRHFPSQGPLLKSQSPQNGPPIVRGFFPSCPHTTTFSSSSPTTFSFYVMFSLFMYPPLL